MEFSFNTWDMLAITEIDSYISLSVFCIELVRKYKYKWHVLLYQFALLNTDNMCVAVV